MDKVKIIEAEYSHRLEVEINNYINGTEINIVSINIYFDNSIDYHVAVIHYKE